MRIRPKNKSLFSPDSQNIAIVPEYNVCLEVSQRRLSLYPENMGGNEKVTVEPELGAHLVTPRTGYTHHGIYIGDGKVIHYSGLADGLEAGPIEETTLAAFNQGYGLSVKEYASPVFSGRVVVERARSRLEENLYSVYGNNCEHFCEWCINDKHLSKQVTRATALTLTTVAGVALRFVTPFPVTAAVTLGYGVYCLSNKTAPSLPKKLQ